MRRTSNVLKLLVGTAQPCRLRDETLIEARAKGKPELPPWSVPSLEVKAVFDWLVQEFPVPKVHGRQDGLLTLHLAECIVARNHATAKVQEFGPVMKHPTSGKPIAQPYFWIAANLDDRIRKLMNDLGYGPAGRLKMCPPLSQTKPGEAGWSDID